MRAALLTLLASSPALACAVCGAGDDPAKGSYLGMSIVISLLPLAMLGGIVGFVAYRARLRDREQREGSPAPVRPPDAAAHEQA